ncbi:STAS domain-containing protein [Candidatus Poribacteria bacterium]|nr:STAS domain-containing protein [Candidatus Poribacteria bacterium]
MDKNMLYIIEKYESELLDDWIKEQLSAPTLRPDLINESELRQQSAKFLNSFREAIQSGNLTNIMSPEWTETREILGQISRSRAERGFTSSETATFVFSLKQPLFNRLIKEFSGKLEALVEETWTVTTLLDKLGLYTNELYQQSREGVIARQQREILELSTPVVQLWDGVLAVPLIGTLDSERTQIVMENLLQMIADTGSNIAIIDITGVPTVDTLVAQHLLKAVAATRLMGADCIISGIRPQIAQTMVTLGVTFDVVTKSTLAKAFELALQRTGLTVTST